MSFLQEPVQRLQMMIESVKHGKRAVRAQLIATHIDRYIGQPEEGEGESRCRHLQEMVSQTVTKR